MATRKITRKVKVVEPDLANPTYTHEWSVEDNTNYASINDFYLTYNNVNYYFTKPNTIEIGDKFYFNINTKVLKLNEDTISTSTTGSSNNELSFVPSHKWSDEYINIGANAENVFCSDGKTVEEKLSGLGGDYVEKTGDTMTGPLNTTELTIGSRANETIVGTHSIAIGENTVAAGNSSFAQGTSEEDASAVITLSGTANTKVYTTNSTTQNIQIGNAIAYNNITAYIVSFVPGVSITLDKTLSINSALDSAEASIIRILSATGECSHAEGHANIASGDSSHAEGSMTAASGFTAHSEGAWTVASGDRSHAEGWQTTASAPAGHAEGTTTTADGESSHAEGYRSRATGRYAHAEGNYTQATVEATHAEGAQTSAIAIGAHAEGLNTIAGGIAAHTEGSHTETKSDYAHAEGFYTTAQRKSQHTEGEYNVLDTTGNTGSRGSFVHIVGNGTADNARSNAHTLDWAGNAWYAGNVYVGSTSGVNKDEGSKKLATEEYVNTNGGKIDSISINNVAQTIDQNKNVNLDLSSYESKDNKVISINSSSTDTQYPSAKAVYTAIESLPEPMIFKGTVGRGGTITTLPTNGSANIGDTYKVMLDGTYADIEAKVGDTFICVSKTETSNTWEIIPSGDEPRGTVTSVTLKASSPIVIDNTAAIIDSGIRTIGHTSSGVTAGTYKSVTVNATGHVTVGTNPTTLSGYGITDAVAKAGDTMTGTLKISSGDLKVITGTIHGEDNGTASYTNHAIKLGHSQEGYCNFYEYGGIFNFYKSVNGTNTPLGKITTNGWEGKALLDTGSTAVTQPTSTNNTTIATTAFVKSVTPNIRITNTDPGIGSALSNGNIILVYEV